MPELPEVETTRRGILRAVAGRRIKRVVVRDARLRWRVPARLARALAGQRIKSVDRRGKYLIFRTLAENTGIRARRVLTVAGGGTT